eukprot:CAMPEP_0173151482 /NCGR_PEP_ID=MMETSP1105-20130129/11606_1 /TAXON_ID=2985 /ORGANISM="Ochromonas sp., Strain BG-1" /LENGTH=526 /DNA_ID=CAMNT_0014066865 /DNA_START=234 /DNA_END=1814 /DNA_ORIENTATION=+
MEPLTPSSPGSTRLFSSQNPASSAPAIPSVNYFSIDPQSNALQFGDLELIASQQKSPIEYTDVSKLGTSEGPAIGTKVWIRGRVNSVRAKGNVCFLVLRSKAFYTIQACHFKDKQSPEESKALIKYVSALSAESIVDIYGEITAADVKACSQNNVEIQIKKIFTVSRAPSVLPFLLEDAGRSQKEIDESQSTDRPYSGVNQDNRLNNRWLDLRVPANNAVMRIRSGVSMLFREGLLNEGFIEINTPKLIAGESEGGSEVFRTDYFGTPACLAQSPQLYKQMAISSDLDRVFEIGPVFRAEKSNTRRHLCEFTGLDLEMAINSHYEETLQVIHRMFRHIFNGLEQRFAKELAVIRTQYPSEPVRFTDEPLIIHWWDAIKMIRDHGHEAGDYDDLSTSQELILGEIVKNKYNADFYMIDQYPSQIRPFYTMPSQLDGNYSNSYDIFLRGQEICSGAQRCHEPELLTQRILAKGMVLDPLQSYIDSFRHGISPHAGAGIGLDRVVFLYLGLDNVRKASMFPRDPSRITP